MDAPPPLPGALPPPPEELPAPATHRRAWVVAAGLTVAASIGVAVAMTGGGPWWPDRIQGFQRLRTAEARSFEDEVSASNEGHVRFVGAVYGGAGDQVEFLVARLDSISPEVRATPLDGFFQSSAAGFETGSDSIGNVDTGSALTESSAGIEYECAPFALTASSDLFNNGSSSGVLCAWKGATFGLLITFATTDLSVAFDEAEATYAALKAPH